MTRQKKGSTKDPAWIVRLPKAEREQVTLAARKVGLTRADYIRSRLAQAALGDAPLTTRAQ